MADVKKVSYRRCKDGWVRIAVPMRLLQKRYMEVKVSEWNEGRAHSRSVQRWMPSWEVHKWLTDQTGDREKWKMDYRTREIAVQDEQVAFMFKLRWA